MDYQLNCSNHRKTYHFRGFGWGGVVFGFLFKREKGNFLQAFQRLSWLWGFFGLAVGLS